MTLLQSTRGIQSRSEITGLLSSAAVLQTSEKVRAVLRKSGIDVNKQESNGFLVIMDPYEAFLGFRQDKELFFSKLVSHAILSGKSGICIMTDMAAGRLKVRGFCTCHKRDFEKLPEGQRKTIFDEGYKSLTVQQTS